MYKVYYSKGYKRDFKRLSCSGRFDRERLETVIKSLAKGESLAPSFRIHSLHGKLSGSLECHIEPDLLLVYKKFDDILILNLVRLGSHSDIFDS